MFIFLLLLYIFIAYMTPTISSNKSHARFCHLVVYIFGERFSSKTTTRISTYLCWPVGSPCTYLQNQPRKSLPSVTKMTAESKLIKFFKGINILHCLYYNPIGVEIFTYIFMGGQPDPPFKKMSIFYRVPFTCHEVYSFLKQQILAMKM